MNRIRHGQALGWICLVLVTSTTAYALQLTTTALMPPVAAASQLISSTLTRKVIIVAVDAATGDRAQLECRAPTNAFASDVVAVDADDFPEVAQACVEVNPLAGGVR